MCRYVLKILARRAVVPSVKILSGCGRVDLTKIGRSGWPRSRYVLMFN
jgi:hypothetical protein